MRIEKKLRSKKNKIQEKQRSRKNKDPRKTKIEENEDEMEKKRMRPFCEEDESLLKDALNIFVFIQSSEKRSGLNIIISFFPYLHPFQMKISEFV